MSESIRLVNKLNKTRSQMTASQRVFCDISGYNMVDFLYGSKSLKRPTLDVVYENAKSEQEKIEIIKIKFKNEGIQATDENLIYMFNSIESKKEYLDDWHIPYSNIAIKIK